MSACPIEPDCDNPTHASHPTFAASPARVRAARWLAAHEGYPDDWPGYGTLADELLTAIGQET